jgi:hypothetical protein
MLNNKITLALIEVFFPELSNYQITRNLKNKITRVESNGVTLDGERFDLFTSNYERLGLIVREKLNLMSLLKDLHKI